MHEVDARGLSCPEPAMMALEAINAFPGEEIRILVSSAVSKQNVSEIAKKRGREVVVEQDGMDFILTVR